MRQEFLRRLCRTLSESDVNLQSQWTVKYRSRLKAGETKMKRNCSRNTTLTLKMSRKPISENVACLCLLLNILANFSNLFLHTGKQCSLIRVHTVCKNDLKSQADDKADDNCCDWQFKGKLYKFTCYLRMFLKHVDELVSSVQPSQSL